jgi:hypothetical protein
MSIVVPVNTLYLAQYYKSANQNMTNGNTDITFNTEQPWNNSGSFITLTNNTANFTVNQQGLYQLELNLTVNYNGATWNVAQNKVISIDITRVGSSEVVAFGQANVVATGGNYIMSCSSTFYLNKGDIINCRHYGNFATATPNIAGAVGFDLNTWFTWKYISSV